MVVEQQQRMMLLAEAVDEEEVVVMVVVGDGRWTVAVAVAVAVVASRSLGKCRDGGGTVLEETVGDSGRAARQMRERFLLLCDGRCTMYRTVLWVGLRWR